MELKGSLEQAGENIKFNFGATDQATLEAALNSAAAVFSLPSATALLIGSVTGGDTSKAVSFDSSGATTAKTLTLSTSHTDDRTLSLPDATDTLVARDTTDTLTNKTLTTPLITTNGSIDVTGAGTLTIGDTSTTLTLGGGSSTVSIPGDLTVSGTTTTVNTATLDVEDPNITVNNGGTQATANSAVSGLTVEMSDATDAVFGYDSSLASKFKLGETGSLIEVADVSSSQTLTNKTIAGGSNTISGLSHGSEVDNPSSGVHGVVGSVVGTSDAQTLTSKTLTSPKITDAGPGDLVVTSASGATVDRTLTFDVTDANRRIDIAGDITLAGGFTTTSSDLTLTLSGSTNVTLPTTGTLASLAGTEAFTNKDYDGGTASDSLRVTLPKNTTGNLNGLTRKEGTLVYDTTTNEVKFDDGSTLTALSSLDVSQGLTTNNTSIASKTVSASTTLFIPYLTIDTPHTYTVDSGGQLVSVDNITVDGTLTVNGECKIL